MESIYDQRHPHFKKVQRQATKFILNDYESQATKTRLLKLDLLPLMYTLDFYDILFYQSLPTAIIMHIIFNINHYITFSHANTRSSTTNKLHHVHTHNNCFHNFYLTDCQDFETPSHQLT